jgi:hypothetical protein
LNKGGYVINMVEEINKNTLITLIVRMATNSTNHGRP